jgi:hypothetical protein
MHSRVSDDTSIHAMQTVSDPWAVYGEGEASAVTRDGVIAVTLT